MFNWQKIQQRVFQIVQWNIIWTSISVKIEILTWLNSKRIRSIVHLSHQLVHQNQDTHPIELKNILIKLKDLSLLFWCQGSMVSNRLIQPDRVIILQIGPSLLNSSQRKRKNRIYNLKNLISRITNKLYQSQAEKDMNKVHQEVLILLISYKDNIKGTIKVIIIKSFKVNAHSCLHFYQL